MHVSKFSAGRKTDVGIMFFKRRSVLVLFQIKEHKTAKSHSHRYLFINKEARHIFGRNRTANPFEGVKASTFSYNVKKQWNKYVEGDFTCKIYRKTVTTAVSRICY